MAFSRDQVSNQGSGGLTGTVSVNFTNGNPSANAFVVFCVWYANFNSPPTVTDNAGNNYVLAKQQPFSTFMGISLFYTNYKLTIPGSALTITATAPINVGTGIPTTSFWGAQAASYTSSTAGTVIADAAASNTTTGTSTGFTFGSGNPAQSGELHVSAMVQNSAGTNEGVGLSVIFGQSGQYSLVGTPVNNGSSFQVGGMADMISTDANVKRVSWFWSANDSTSYSSVIVPFLVTPFAQKTSYVENVAVSRAASR